MNYEFGFLDKKERVKYEYGKVFEARRQLDNAYLKFQEHKQ